MKSIIFGSSGLLAQGIARSLLERDWDVDLVSRSPMEDLSTVLTGNDNGRQQVNSLPVDGCYSKFEYAENYNAVFITQAIFDPSPLIENSPAWIEEQVRTGLTVPILLTQKALLRYPAIPGVRRDFCLIGSTSAYNGFKDSSIYCSVKHGLLGFVRAMNDEYSHTDDRFWLFSMGSMDTPTGAKLKHQDRSSFLRPDDVAERIVNTITSASNIFEPEVIMRRRVIGTVIN